MDSYLTCINVFHNFILDFLTDRLFKSKKMKKSIIVSCLLLLSFINSNGQWYVKKYNVTDINFLSREQLEESLGKSKNALLFSGCIAGSGGLFMILSIYVHPGMSEDPSVFEQLIGDKGIDNILLYAGAGMLVGGTIASIVYLGRVGRIKSVIKKNYPSVGSLDISPAIILNSYTRSYSPGFTLTYNF